jgi:alpha-tubulin suppressor-like RCC1 family protein
VGTVAVQILNIAGTLNSADIPKPWVYDTGPGPPENLTVSLGLYDHDTFDGTVDAGLVSPPVRWRSDAHPFVFSTPEMGSSASAATCAETEVGVSVAADLAACAGVSELADDVACLAILTDSAVDDAATKACTYVAADLKLAVELFATQSFLYTAADEAGNTASCVVTVHTTDVDECDDGTHICHANAECENQEYGPEGASYACECRPGFTGDGWDCAAHILGVSGMGWNGFANLGLGHTIHQDTPVMIPDMTGVASVAPCGYATFFLKTDGTVWGTGGRYGELGLGDIIPRNIHGSSIVNGVPGPERNTPVLMPDMLAVLSISSGNGHVLLLKADGTAWGLGRNNFGQLGLGHSDNEITPMLITSGITSIEAGSHFSLLLKTDGTVLATGWNTKGQLGLGHVNPVTSPVAVPGMSGITSMGAGRQRSFFLMAELTITNAWATNVWATGANQYGQLGLGHKVDVSVPEPVASISGITSIAAGYYYSLFLQADGTVLATGRNRYGQLGMGDYDDLSTPVAIPGISGVTSVAAGYAHSLLLLANGTVLAMGRNDNGQLGLGFKTQTSNLQPDQQATPVAIPGVSGVTAVAAMGGASFLLVPV